MTLQSKDSETDMNSTLSQLARTNMRCQTLYYMTLNYLSSSWCILMTKRISEKLYWFINFEKNQ